MDETIFAPLTTLSPRAFTEAAYQFLILLRHRSLLKQATANQLLEPVRVNGVVKTSSAIKQALQSTLQAIEVQEGKSLEDMSDSELDKYQEQIGKLMLQRAQESAGSYESSTSALDELRSLSPPLKSTLPNTKAATPAMKTSDPRLESGFSKRSMRNTVNSSGGAKRARTTVAA